MNKQAETIDFKLLYETTLMQNNLLQQKLEAKNNELLLLNKIRAMQAKKILAYEKQIKQLGGTLLTEKVNLK